MKGLSKLVLHVQATVVILVVASPKVFEVLAASHGPKSLSAS